MPEIETSKLKEIIKEAISEVIVSNKDFIYDVFYEALEDYHLLNAMREGENSGLATREEVFSILEAK